MKEKFNLANQCGFSVWFVQTCLDESAPRTGSKICFLYIYFFISTLESVGTMSETLHAKASDDVYKRIGQKFNDVKLENEKKS